MSGFFQAGGGLPNQWQDAFSGTNSGLHNTYAYLGANPPFTPTIGAGTLVLSRAIIGATSSICMVPLNVGGAAGVDQFCEFDWLGETASMGEGPGCFCSGRNELNYGYYVLVILTGVPTYRIRKVEGVGAGVVTDISGDIAAPVVGHTYRLEARLSGADVVLTALDNGVITAGPLTDVAPNPQRQLGIPGICCRTSSVGNFTIDNLNCGAL